MKFVVIVTITTLFLFFSSAFAGVCFPVAQIYSNPKTKIEKQLSCKDLLNKVTKFPFPTTSFIRTDVVNGDSAFCASRDISSMQKLTFEDFSNLDKIKIIINILFILLLALLPLILLIISRKLKSLLLRIVLDVVLVVGYIPWLLIISFRLAC